MVFEAFEGGRRGDRVGAVGIAVTLVRRVVFMIGAGVRGGGRVGIEKGRGMRFHLHLGMTASDGDFGGIGGVFVNKEVEDVDRLGVLRGYGGRRGRCFWGRINNGNGILGVAVKGIFDVGFAGYEGGGC